MPIRQTGRRAFACLATTLLLAGTAQAATKLTITSPAGEPLGGGTGTKTYTAPTASIGWSGGGHRYDVEVSQGTEFYRIALVAPEGDLMLPGSYANAELDGRVTGQAPGIKVESHNGSCEDAWGSFVIRQGSPFEYHHDVAKLEATFTFRCGSATAPALTGTILIDAGPRYFSYSRDAGFPHGTATSKSYYNNNSETDAFGTAAGIDISVKGQRDEWLFRFFPPTGRSFAKGIYTLANEADTTRAGLEINEYTDAFCAGLAGSVNIRNVAYDGDGNLTGLYATWTITCDGQPAKFNGTFHHDL